MSVTIDSTEKIDLNLNPTTIEEEVVQNLWLLYSSLEYDCPLDMELGLKATYIDRPIDAATALATADIYEKTEKYEPRAEVIDVTYNVDYQRGKIKPIVEVEINGEYNEDDTY